MNGEWSDVCSAGTERRIRTVVFSSSQRIVDEAQQLGVEAVLKSPSEEDSRKAAKLFEDK